MVINTSDYYKRCNLKENPFRTNPNFATDPRAGIWVGYQREKNRLTKFLRRSLSDQIGNVNFLMLYGDYGTGKSHALLWARNRIVESEKDNYQSVCYFIPTLRKGKGKLTFAEAFLDDIVDGSNLVAEVREFRSFLRDCISKYENRKKVEYGVQYKQLSEENIIENLIPPKELHKFAKDIYQCQEDDEQIRKLLAPKPLTDYQAMMIFTKLVNLFVYEIKVSESESRRFKKAVYLFIDELDDLSRASIKEAREINDLLRRIYDNCPNCFCMVIALAAEVTQITALFFDYILTRINHQIELDTLNKDDAVKFVREILDFDRINPQGATGYFPFEKESIVTIASQLTEITPRKIVTTMQQVIEEVRLAGHNPDDGLVSVDFFNEHDILEEVLDVGGIW